MEVKITKDPEVTIIAISGRLDTNTSPELEKALEPVLFGDISHIIVDCNDLSYVSSSGLRLFLILQKNISAKKGSLSLRGLNPAIKEVFNITGFAAIFRIE